MNEFEKALEKAEAESAWEAERHENAGMSEKAAEFRECASATREMLRKERMSQ